MPRAPCALAMTEAERTCVSFRDQSADWSWESVIPLGKSKGERIATTSDIDHWFAMTGFFHELRCKSGRRGEGTPPYNHTLCGAGPACPAVGALENRFGSSGRPTPTLHSTIELRRGGRPCPDKRSGRLLLWVNIGKLLVSGRSLTVMAFYAILKSESIGVPHTV